MGEKKVKIGQTLYSLNIGNSARGCEQKLTPVVVSKIGRKYFTVKESDYFETQHYLDGWCEKSEYISNSRLYVSPQEWEDDKEKEKLNHLIGGEFKLLNSKLPLEALRKIHSIIIDMRIE